MPPKSTLVKSVKKVVSAYVSPMQNQPKRPANAYSRYVQSYLNAGKEAIAEGTESAKRSFAAAGESWKQLAETEKQTYKDAFEKDSKIYNDAKAVWQKEVDAWSTNLSVEDKAAFKKALKEDKSLKPLQKYTRTPGGANAWLVFLQEYWTKNGANFTGPNRATEVAKAAAKAYKAEKGL